jgi:Fic family protein
MDPELVLLLSAADQALGRLDGMARTLPNPELFVAMYVRREAVLSSEIEGTQSTLDDVLTYELVGETDSLPRDVSEVVNYVRAMDYGLDRLKVLPLSLRLIREIHSQLLPSGRGATRMPGEFRTSQNWIGPEGGTISNARFVPPPVHEMTQALGDLEDFLHRPSVHPDLIDCALAHAQFETIHPFLDGNGRVGRLLVTFLLVTRGVLQLPLLYLSYYLRLHRAEYYDRLTAVREDGDWEGWVKFFLDGVRVTAEEASRTAGLIVRLRDSHQSLVASGGGKALRLLALLYLRPIVSVSAIRDMIGVSFPTASKLVNQFVAHGLLEELTGYRRNRVYRYTPYLALLRESAGEIGADAGASEATGSDPVADRFPHWPEVEASETDDMRR